jgi:hypothetical protein
MRTSCAARPEMPGGRAIWTRKPARSTSVPSGLLEEVVRQDLLEAAYVGALAWDLSDRAIASPP